MERTTSGGNRRDLADQIVDSSKKEVKERSTSPPDPSRLIPTGSTLLNCACADNPWSGFGLGKLVNLIGDSSAGKTLLALTTFAEVCEHKRFKEYRLIFDDAEEALEFDLSYLLGTKVAKRIEPPQGTKKQPKYSNTAEDFKANVLNAVREDEPFIYVLDSFDALTTKEEEDKAYKKALKAAGTETEAKEIKDAHKAKKAAHASELYRLVCGELKKTDSTLIVVSQVRDLIGALPFGPKKTRSGGRALKFYSTHEMWMVIKGRERRKKRKVGINAVIDITKNKLTGKERDVPIKIWYDYGIDDISVNIDFLLEEEHWRKKKQTILAKEFNIEATKGVLLEQIEERGMEKILG